MRKRVFPIYYARGKRLFQVIVHISDAPGSLGEVLRILGSMVNLIGTSTYTLGDGTAMFIAFTQALTSSVSPEKVQSALGGSPAAIESEVREGQDGLLVDTFHTGLDVANEDFMLLRRGGMGSVFDHIVKIFGSGGEVLLYEEGVAMAGENAERTQAALTPPVVRNNMTYLVNFLSAQGWGTFEMERGRGELEFEVAISDCFECAKGSPVRKRCDFVRGYFEGSASAVFGVPMQVEEAECVLRGAKACVFRIAPRRRK